MTDKIRVAVIGAGIGAEHVKGYLENEDRYRVVVVCDLDAARAARAAGLCGADVETGYAATLARRDVDLVDICLPPYLHLSAIEQALASGRHVLCEKPLVSGLEEVESVARMAERVARSVTPVYQYRYGDGLRRLKRLIERGLAGRPLVASLETHWDRGPGYYDVAWRGRRSTELGGAMIGHAIHVHDLLTEAMGPVRRVFAKVAMRVNPVETEDCAAITLEMESGALVTSSVTLGSAEEITRLRFCFSELTAESPGAPPYRPAEGDWRYLPRGARTGAEIEGALAGLEPARQSFAGLFAALAPALNGAAPFPVTLADAWRSLELASAIYYSSATSSAVDLPLPPDHPVRAGWGRWLPGAAADAAAR